QLPQFSFSLKLLNISIQVNVRDIEMIGLQRTVDKIISRACTYIISPGSPAQLIAFIIIIRISPSLSSIDRAVPAHRADIAGKLLCMSAHVEASGVIFGSRIVSAVVVERHSENITPYTIFI